VAFATHGFLVFVTLQPWTFKLLFPIFAIFYYGNRNTSFKRLKKRAERTEIPALNPGPKKIG
jgi:hypothetical protein